MQDGPSPVLEMRNIVKRFPGGVVANDHVNFSVEEGEIHGLLGENGAGKSTLMKILFGLYRPDDGEIYLKGEGVDISEPSDAIDAGLGMVHQHFMLIPRLPVVDNVALSQERGPVGDGNEGPASGRVLSSLLRPFMYNRGRERSRLREIMDEYDMNIDPDAKIWELEVGLQQRVEILKALYREVDVLILDEPTAVLSEREAEQLFETVSTLAEEGMSVILITHHLNEIVENTDRVTVLRDGSVIDTVETSEKTIEELAEMMVGREVLFDIDKPLTNRGERVLEASDLRIRDDRGIEAIKGVDLSLHRGETLGIAGVSGNGQLELLETLAGVRDAKEGTLRVDGQDLIGKSSAQFADAGISYIPADRFKYGCIPSRSVMDNCILKERHDFKSGAFLDYDKAAEYARQLVEEFDVRVPNVDVPVEKLSGGNLQKLILARELSRDPEVVIANQPTRGLDVGAIEFVREQLLEQREQGAGILLVSEDLDEVLQLSDRILVLSGGQFVHETSSEDADRDRISLLMAEGETGVEVEADVAESPPVQSTNTEVDS